VYFASEIARGLQECEPQYREYQRQVISTQGEPIADPLSNIQDLLREVKSVMSGVVRIISPALEPIFGDKGHSGDEVAIRATAGAICAIYDELICWGIRVRNANVEPKWQPLYVAVSKMVGLPLHQFQDFSAALSAQVSRVIGELRMGRASEPINVKLDLYMDPVAAKEVDGALQVLKDNR
jgi:hypothetical protein